jgi:hypothetical protein
MYGLLVCFGRTFKMFVADAAKRKNAIKQLDFIGAFCQGKMQKRLFIQLPQEFSDLLPEFAEYLQSPQLIVKSIYGTDVAGKVFNDVLVGWLKTNDHVKFIQSKIDPSLFVHGNGNEYCYLIVYIDDCLYEILSSVLEEKFTNHLKK